MSPALSVLAASVTTFAATNLDDLFLLTVFFARRVTARRIVAGQYLGFAAIVLISLAGVFAAGAAVPHGWIRLLGIFPLAIGVKELVQLRNSKSTRTAERNGSLNVFSIAAITLANGADNISVFVPFFSPVDRTFVWFWPVTPSWSSCGVRARSGLEATRLF